MTWHAEIITLTLRRYAPGESYEGRDRFASVATAQLMGGTRAYISGFLSDGTKGPIHKRDWVALAALLREQFGIAQIESERHGQDRGYETGPAPL